MLSSDRLLVLFLDITGTELGFTCCWLSADDKYITYTLRDWGLFIFKEVVSAYQACIGVVKGLTLQKIKLTICRLEVRTHNKSSFTSYELLPHKWPAFNILNNVLNVNCFQRMIHNWWLLTTTDKLLWNRNVEGVTCRVIIFDWCLRCWQLFFFQFVSFLLSNKRDLLSKYVFPHHFSVALCIHYIRLRNLRGSISK